MTDIKFSRAETEAIVHRIQLYFGQELKQDIGRFDAEFLLEFFTHEIGTYFYNRGLSDAQQALSEKLDELSYAISGLEKPVESPRRDR
ncbi:uncharacterized protein (DUF2164 family) [Luteimonas cucumeris]|uniref:Uncharacterized protein (DUF2164 family) n=1 Tax=Luteimonas cucumeris TaxID=985012 RepID=A0A562LEC5_9GAMM|nr:DUF2164 domain-containing protein [Luteimonas cucumeris]TWI06001.1 uncharacterized protein (DUF2164 family) [Luteimonas cucumeris]